MKDRERVIFGRKVYWGEAVEATGGSWVMLYVQNAGAACEVFTVRDNSSMINPQCRGRIRYQKVVRDAP
jgi:hypothetical protein